MLTPLFPSQKIYLANSKIPKAGRGVFAKSRIHEGDSIEICPVLVLTSKELDLLRKTELNNYVFLWGEQLEKVAVCFGFGSMYNHSYKPNATYVKKFQNSTIEFVAIKDIKDNEEITVNYNFGDPTDTTPLWIKDIK